MLSYERVYRPPGTRIALKNALDNQIWDLQTGEECAEYLEAFSFSANNGTILADDAAKYRCTGTLKQHEILEWAYQRHAFQPPRHSNPNAKLQGGIRLLILERRYYQPCSFDLKKETFQSITQHFHLPDITLPALSDESGLSSYDMIVNDDGSPKRLTMAIKAAQKWQVGNYGLSFSHDFHTGISTGILHGTGVTSFGRDYELWASCPATELFQLAVASVQSWPHPLCLPLLMLHHHLQRTDYFCTIMLSTQHTEVQRQLGTLRAGRLNRSQPRNIVSDLAVQEAKVNLRDLTVAMSNLSFEAVWFSRVSEWQCETLKSLSEALREIASLKQNLPGSEFVKARIGYLNETAKSIRRTNNGLKENCQTDMSVLYSMISQVDNRLNAKMAAASSRDSAAMKTLAFLTTLFLPGTFIATVFSTGMFNWHIDSESQRAATERANDSQSQANNLELPEESTISHLFWVYWAVSIPLTILVAIGWRVWWSLEKKRFDRDVNVEINAVDSGDGNGEDRSMNSEDLYMVPPRRRSPFRTLLGKKRKGTGETILMVGGGESGHD